MSLKEREAVLERYSRLLCSAPWNGCTVHWSGLVFPCCSICEDHGSPGGHSLNMVLGDLTRQSLAEILGGEAAWRLRRAWVEGDLSGHCCGHCHETRLQSCSPYFQTDVHTAYVEGSFVHREGKVERVRAAPFPVSRIEAQVNASCQLRCTFCNLDYAPTGAPHLKRLGHMDVALLEKLLDQAAELGGGGAELYTHWSGEPLLHPQRERIYEVIGRRPFFHTTLVTNGLHLTPDFVDHLLRQPRVPMIYVSIHAATPQGFARTTGRDFFGRAQENVSILLEKRKAAGREDEMVVFIGFTVVPENIDELEPFIAEWRRIFAETDRPPTIQLNGRGRSSRNALIIVGNGVDPRSEAMRRAFWLIEEARSDQEPCMPEVERFAETDAWRDWHDPVREFLDLEHRVESRALYAPDEISRGRYRVLLAALLLRQAHFESATRGLVSDQTAGRLLGLLGDSSWNPRDGFDRCLRRSPDLDLRLSEEAREAFRQGLSIELPLALCGDAAGAASRAIPSHGLE